MHQKGIGNYSLLRTILSPKLSALAIVLLYLPAFLFVLDMFLLFGLDIDIKLFFLSLPILSFVNVLLALLVVFYPKSLLTTKKHSSLLGFLFFFSFAVAEGITFAIFLW